MTEERRKHKYDKTQKDWNIEVEMRKEIKKATKIKKKH